IDRHIFDLEPVNRFAVVLRRSDVEIGGILFRITAPADCAANQMTNRVDLVPRAKCSSEIGNSRTEHEERVAHFLLARWIPVWHLELPWALLAELNCVLQGVNLLNVLRIIGIDQRAQPEKHITRT